MGRLAESHFLLPMTKHMVDVMFQLMGCLGQRRDILADKDFLESSVVLGNRTRGPSSHQSLQWSFTGFEGIRIVLVTMKPERM